MMRLVFDIPVFVSRIGLGQGYLLRMGHQVLEGNEGELLGS